MRYHCQFPDCEYSTDSRHLIHEHHIVPESMGGTDKPYNKVFLCPNDHHLVFVENSIGLHSIRSPASIIIHGWRMTTEGRELEYEMADGETLYSAISL